MNWKNRLTNYNFWISLFSASLLILQALKIEFDVAYINEIFTAVLGLLVVIGIISDPTRTSVKSTDSSSAVVNQTESVEAEKTLETDNENQKKEAKPLPTDKEDEVNNDNIQTNIQTILTQISTDLDKKFNEIKQLNLNSANKLLQQETSIKKEESNEVNTSVEETLPAVAEMENPYIDVVN